MVTANDYYPFGSLMPGRKYIASSSKYRYGFNGKENDNEVKGEGNQQDYGLRIYDPRLGKFLSVDPLTQSYPELTPYQFASNSPIASVDLDGKEAWIAIYSQIDNQQPVLKMVFDKDVVNPGGLYQIHNYYTITPEGKSALTGRSSGSDNYSSYKEYFPNFSKGIHEKFSYSNFLSSFNLKGEANVLFGEVGLEGEAAGAKLGGSIGVEGKLIGLNFDAQDRTGKLPVLGWNSTLKKTDGKVNVGGGIAFGAGLSYRQKADFNTLKPLNDNEITYNGIVTSASINTYSKDAKLSWGLGGKLAIGIGLNFDTKFEINMTKLGQSLKSLSIKYSQYEKKELNTTQSAKKEFDPTKY